MDEQRLQLIADQEFAPTSYPSAEEVPTVFLPSGVIVPPITYTVLATAAIAWSHRAVPIEAALLQAPATESYSSEVAVTVF